MPFHYFLPVPELSSEVRDHTSGVELVAWLVKERDAIRTGQGVAQVQTRWAVLELIAAGDGVLGKQIFDPGTHVREGDPLAVIYADGEALPYGRSPVEVRVVAIMQVKASRAGGGTNRDRAT